MRKHLFFIVSILCLSYNPIAKSQDTISHDDLIERSQKSVEESIKIFYQELEDFDRECFLLGTMDDNMGHYQTFTSNKSLDDMDDKVKWMFKKDAEFIPDTMAHQRITTYETNGDGSWHTELALVVVELFKKDYPDLRALRVCNSSTPARKHYGNDIKSVLYDREDSICKRSFPIKPPPYVIELYSSFLAKTMASYYSFDPERQSLPVISTGGDIGYRGIIDKEKIATRPQKISFLMGVFMRYGYKRINDEYGSDCYSISIPNSLSTATKCAEILQEMGCEQVAYIDKFPYGHQILCTFSLEVDKVKSITSKIQKELHSRLVAF